MRAANDHFMPLVCESVAAHLAKTCGLGIKEQRLLTYILDDSNSYIIGDICKALKTTTWTLLTKTQPGLFRKIGKPGSESWNENIQQALESGETPQLVTSRRIDFYSGKRA